MYTHNEKIFCNRCDISIDEFNYDILDEVVEFHCPGCGDSNLLTMMSVDDYLESVAKQREKEANTVSGDDE